MKTMAFKSAGLVLFLIMFASCIYGQTENTTLSGIQTRGSVGQKASMKLDPLVLKKAFVITAVTGHNAGFWIENSKGKVVKQYTAENDSTAKGFVLEPETYLVYPNLKRVQVEAQVELTLEPVEKP